MILVCLTNWFYGDASLLREGRLGHRLGGGAMGEQGAVLLGAESNTMFCS